jgi:hypothetical protein
MDLLLPRRKLLPVSSAATAHQTQKSAKKQADCGDY